MDRSCRGGGNSFRGRILCASAAQYDPVSAGLPGAPHSGVDRPRFRVHGRESPAEQFDHGHRIGTAVRERAEQQYPGIRKERKLPLGGTDGFHLRGDRGGTWFYRLHHCDRTVRGRGL